MEEKKPWYKRPFFWIIISVGLFVISIFLRESVWTTLRFVFAINILLFIITTIILLVDRMRHTKNKYFTWKLPSILLAMFFVILSIVVVFYPDETTTTVSKSKSDSTSFENDDEVYDEEDDSSSSSSDSSVPAESTAALQTANSYVNSSVNLSKAGLYDQLVSEEQFPSDAAQYAIDNVKADWNQIALASAKDYRESIGMSNASIHDQLINQEKFTQQEADYAIQHIDDK